MHKMKLKNVFKSFMRLCKTVFNNICSKVAEFFARSFEVTTKKSHKKAGVITALILMLFVIFQSNTFIIQDFSEKWLLLAVCLISPLIIGLFIAYTVRIKNDFINRIWHFVFFLLMPIASMTMTEALNKIFVYDMTYLGFFANYVVISLLYFIVFALSGSFKLSIIIVNPVLFGFALAHSYLLEFRGTPFIPMDFFSITTAANVANTYNYSFTYNMIAATLLFILLMVVGIKTNTPKYNLITKIISRSFMGAFFAIVCIIFYFTSIFANLGIKPDFWNQSRGYRNYGFVYNFLCNTKYLYMLTPEGYNADEIENMVNNTVSEDKDTQQPNNTITVNDDAPNIICIMNESLADLSILGDFTTNQEYMPFMNSLTENTVKGYTYVPVIGAGTSNSEFEFLTGHTTAFLPSGSNAYMLYIDNPIASLVSTLEAQGYSSSALHPYYASGWNRVNIYNNLGFNSFKFLENIIDISILEEYTENGNKADYLQSLLDFYYPERDNMLIRQYISDHYNYRLIIEDFENRDKTIPYFTFNVTMQNHGGYTQSASNFDECISITSTDVYYEKASKYLSLVKASDDAFKELIEYFSNVDEPTVICMFGDHQPSIESEFIASLLGKSSLSSLTAQEEQLRHATPFIIWANYDIEEQYIEKLSLNYLSSYMLNIAGVELTEYNKYLLKLSETLPVIDTVGYIDSDNNYYRWGENTQYSDILGEYEKIQYNNIFDNKNTNTDIFYLNDFEIQVNKTETQEAQE